MLAQAELRLSVSPGLMLLISLRLLMLRMAEFATLGIFRIPALRKILLSRNCENKLFLAITAEKNTGFKSVIAIHASPSQPTTNHSM